jgi:hypothetical protein
VKSHNNSVIGLLRIGLLILLVTLCVQVVSASTRIVPAGGDVTIGETDLDITNCVYGNMIGWWASAAPLSTAPTRTILVTNKQSFFVDPSDFSGFTGNWYNLNPGGTAGAVAFRVYDCSNCKVDVRVNKLPKPLQKFYHTFVIYTDSSGKEWYYRGGAENVAVPGMWGLLVTEFGPYTPGTVDWNKNAASVTVSSGDEASNKNICFSNELNRIAALHKSYNPLGPNCNTVAYTILKNCDIQPQNPVKNTMLIPGWGQTV